MTMDRIAIIGGGPGGLMLARLLQLRGLSPVVFERDAHAEERPQGGSLDLHGETGQRAMRLARLEAEFAAAARPENGGAGVGPFRFFGAARKQKRGAGEGDENFLRGGIHGGERRIESN